MLLVIFDGNICDPVNQELMNYRHIRTKTFSHESSKVVARMTAIMIIDISNWLQDVLLNSPAVSNVSCDAMRVGQKPLWAHLEQHFY